VLVSVYIGIVATSYVTFAPNGFKVPHMLNPKNEPVIIATRWVRTKIKKQV